MRVPPLRSARSSGRAQCRFLRGDPAPGEEEATLANNRDSNDDPIRRLSALLLMLDITLVLVLILKALA
jgi:hypothetical protein